MRRVSALAEKESSSAEVLLLENLLGKVLQMLHIQVSGKEGLPPHVDDVGNRPRDGSEYWSTRIIQSARRADANRVEIDSDPGPEEKHFALQISH